MLKNDVTIRFMLPQDLKRKIEEAAEKEQCSAAQLIRKAIREYLEKHSKDSF